MASNYWAKFWIEMLDDRKTASLPDNLWRRFCECILLAKELNQSGRLPTIEDMSWRLRVEAETLQQELEALARRGLLDYRADKPLDGFWYIVNFEKRQARMSGAERVKRHRESQMKQLYNEPSNALVTKRYTEEEEETETEEEAEVRQTDFRALFDAFINSTGIPETMLVNGKNVDVITDWVKSGITPEEIEQAVSEMMEKDLTIVRPASINNALIIVRQRGGKKPVARDERTVTVENPITGKLEEVTVK